MKKLFISALALLTFASCSTIMNGKTQNIKIKSKSNQMIKVTDLYGDVIAEGRGELEVKLRRGTEWMANYPDKMYLQYGVKTPLQDIKLLSKTNLAYYLGNAFTFGIGYLVDNANRSTSTIIYQDKEVDTLILE